MLGGGFGAGAAGADVECKDNHELVSTWQIAGVTSCQELRSYVHELEFECTTNVYDELAHIRNKHK